MQSRAQIPVPLPHASPTTSYWQDPPDPELADYQSSTFPAGTETVDTVVIGSGISGARIAWGLLGDEDGDVKGEKRRVVMLEARQTCSGASGRNGGHTKAASHRSFPSNLSSLGLAQALKIARLEYQNILSTHAFAAKHSISCESRLCDTVDIIYDDRQWSRCLSAVALIKKHFTEPGDSQGIARYELYSAEEAREKFFVKGRSVAGEGVKGAVRYVAGSISAYRFVCGVLKMCLERGLELFTHTPVLGLFRTESGVWILQTEKGVLTSRNVVLATNGYTARLFPGFQGAIVPLRGQVTAQKPGLGMPKEGLETTYSFIYGNGYEYMIPRPPSSPFPGDIIIGGGLAHATNEGLEEYGTTDDSSLNPVISSYLDKTLVSYFGEAWGEDQTPSLIDQTSSVGPVGEGGQAALAGESGGEGRVRKEWTGIMGYTPDGFPFIGPVPGMRGLFVSAGFLGHGMVMCWECGGEVARMIEGREGESAFPEAFLITEERMGMRFEGRLHVGA